MKQMIYTNDFCYTPEVLDSGIYKNRKYVILSLGHHPTAYVELKSYELQKSNSYDDYCLDVHGGFTYLGNLKCDIFTTYIGWDYCHLEDYTPFDDLCGITNTKKWTTEEILEEVKSVIDQFEKAVWNGNNELVVGEDV